MQRKNQKILVLCRDLDHTGGVVNYYRSIFKHYKSETFNIEHFRIGRRLGTTSNVYYALVMIYDVARLILKLLDRNYVLVHLNPSLTATSLARDSLLLLAAKSFRRKILVFWRGWEKTFENRIDNSRILLRLFRHVFNKADAFIVLASAFKDKLREWGFRQSVFLDTTVVDDDLLKGFSLPDKLAQIKTGENIQILFLSRLELAKGIIETIDAFNELGSERVILVIAGDGPDAPLVLNHIEQSRNARIKFIGYVRGEAKKRVLESSHLMCLPTYYGEGLPNSMIEAMAFGLAIITRPVGGIVDNFTDSENGHYAHSLDKRYLSSLLERTILDRRTMAQISINNHNLAKERFVASQVAKRLDTIYKSVMAG